MPLTRLIGPDFTIGSQTNRFDDRMYGTVHAANATGVVKQMRFYSNDSGNLKYCIYESTRTDALLIQNTGQAAVGGQWNSFDTPTDLAVSLGTSYFLTGLVDTIGTLTRISQAASTYVLTMPYDDGLPDPLSGEGAASSYIILVQAWGYEPPTISDVDGDDTVSAGQTNVDVTANNLEDVRGTGKIELCNNAVYGSATVKVEQTYNSWADGLANIDVVQGGLSAGTVYVFATTDSDQQNATGFPITLSGGAAGNDAVATADIGGLNSSAAATQSNDAAATADIGGLNSSAAATQSNDAAATADIGGLNSSAAATQSNDAAATADIGGLNSFASASNTVPGNNAVAAAGIGGLNSSAAATQSNDAVAAAGIGGLNSFASASNQAPSTAPRAEPIPLHVDDSVLKLHVDDSILKVVGP